MREWFRKKIVSLKRNPQMIALVFMVITMLVYNLNLTKFSDTISYVNSGAIGLYEFIVTLCSFLSVITYLQAFPRRQNVKKMSIIIVIVMLAISIACEALFYYQVYFALYKADRTFKPEVIELLKSTQTISMVHMIMLGVSIVMVLLVPVFKKLLAKINTSITIEESQVKESFISEEDV